MARFSIDRGHDGPARKGTLELGEKKISSPAVVGHPNDAIDYSYYTLNRDQAPKSDIKLISLGSATGWGSNKITDIPNNSMVLLPGLPGFPNISDDAGIEYLRFQIEIVQELSESVDTSQLIVRLPSSLQIDQFDSILNTLIGSGVANAAFLFEGTSGPRDLNRIIARSRLPSNWAVYALGRIPPSMLSVLYYAGFDFFDLGYAWTSAYENIRLWPNEPEKIMKTSHPRFCSCFACMNNEILTGKNLDANTSVLLEHNILLYKTLLSEMVHSSDLGTLRQLVEASTHANPSLASLLRRLDQNLYDYLEEFTPTSYSTTHNLIGPESYHAPAIRRYREFLAERYSPPQHKKLVVLLPCSSRKPYSDSKSHKRYIESIVSALGSLRTSVSETILTSPLGVIPRELERIFPAANYDIPVSGDWDEEEIAIGVEALTKHLNKFSDDAVVIAHVSGGYREIVERSLEKLKQTVIFTLEKESPSSQAGLLNLKETLSEMRDILDLGPVDSSLKLETLQATADFQFGPDAGASLIPPNSKITGKLYRMVVARYQNVQTCAYLASNGKLSLTMDGGQRIAHLARYWVRFAGKDVQGGSLFAVGVNDADPKIRPGDEVLILDESDNLLAVGRSEMSGREMCENTRGRAVTIRHKGGE